MNSIANREIRSKIWKHQKGIGGGDNESITRATVCSDKKEGGLDLSKWIWRFANERDSSWRKVISSKFGEDPGDGVHARCEEIMVHEFGKRLERNGRPFFLALFVL